ncbi:MAG TPA: MFS transporter [Paludibacter sp.]|nr:MFS transporter [Paludibacter sp.]
MNSMKFFSQNSKYFASAFLYSCFSLIFSTWVTYIPQIAEKLGITEGRIGKAIFFSALGAFFMIRICRHIVDRVGVGRYTFFALIVYCVFFYGPFLAYSYDTLCLSLFFFGMASSSFAISLNSLTATIEKQDEIYIMSRSHGFWSIGGMIGAATGSFIAVLLHNPILHITILVTIILLIQTKLKSHYYFRKGEQLIKERLKPKNMKPLYVIAVVGLVMMVSEGAIADWGALYLKKIILLNLKYIGFGYAAFSSAMMIGRFTGDSLSKKLGSWQLITYSSSIGILGFLLILTLNPIISVLGFFIVGLGFSVVVPEVYRLASNIEGVKTADGVSFIAATSNIGFLVGPVLLGFIAELNSLHLSFIVLTIFVSLAFFIALTKYKTSKSI